MTVCFLTGLAGCAGDSAKSTSDTVASSAVVQSEEGKDLPASDEVQERAVSRMGAATLKPIVPLSPPASLPGEFIITPALHGGLFTAVDGGGRTVDAITTVAQAVTPNQKFRIWSAGPSAIQYKYISTLNGYFLMAPGGGGRADSSAIVADLHQYPYGQYIDMAKFRFVMPAPIGGGAFTIQTSNGNFVTAVGGGQRRTDVLHTDAMRASTWESFYVSKCGDLGSGFSYGIRSNGSGSFLSAAGGGGQTHGAITANSGALTGLGRFTLVQEPDGLYALRTTNGVNFVTAVNGGGLVQGSATPDILQTDRPQVQAWEKFRIVDDGSCNYTIQTVSGYYLATNGPNFSTDISDPNRATTVGYNAKFNLVMFDL
jgi:hypothetical protein